jgi:hypothetical protein
MIAGRGASARAPTLLHVITPVIAPKSLGVLWRPGGWQGVLVATTARAMPPLRSPCSKHHHKWKDREFHVARLGDCDVELAVVAWLTEETDVEQLVVRGKVPVFVCLTPFSLLAARPVQLSILLAGKGRVFDPRLSCFISVIVENLGFALLVRQ